MRRIFLFICITISMVVIPPDVHKTLSPFLIEVVSFDVDDEVVQYDADASPHDDDL